MNVTNAYKSFIDSMIGVLSPRTVEWYAERLRGLVGTLGEKDPNDVKTDDLRAWYRSLTVKETRRGKLSPHTLAGYVRACRRFFNWLTEEELIDRNPAKRLEAPRAVKRGTYRPKAISSEDLAKMLAAAKASNARDHAIVCFLADTGCRLGGLAGLCVNDLDLGMLRAAVVEKGNKARFVYFGKMTARALQVYLAERDGCDSDRLWIGRRGPLTKVGIYQLFRRLARKAGVVENWNPHAFRHGWAHHALDAGADLGTVSQVLGHSSIQVTHDFYGQRCEAALAERARRFSPLNNTGL